MQFDRVLATFSDYLERERIRLALSGGLAVHAWDRMRRTRDADSAVARRKQPRIIAFAESLCFATRYASEAFSNHEHDDPVWGRVDFMYLQGETAESVLSAVTEKEIAEGLSLPVASPEHLALMKALATKNFSHRASTKVRTFAPC